MADIGSEKTEKLIDTIEQRLNRIYSQAAKETKEKYLAYVEKFKKQEAKKLEDLAKGKITQSQFDEWRERAIFSGKQYQALADTMAKDLTTVNQKAMSIVNGYTPEAYALNRNYAFYQLDLGGVDVAATFTLYDRHTVEKLARGKASLLPKPKVDIPKDQRWNRQHIKNAIAQGVLQGESIPDIAKRLEKVVGMNHSSAVRNARTAMTGAQNAGRVSSYRDARKLGIKVLNEWLATNDSRTRDSHAKINGDRVPDGKKFANGCEYPGDPNGPPEEVYNCRCTLIPYLPDYDFDEDDVSEEGFEEFQDANVNDEYARIKKAIDNAVDYDYDWHEENDFSWDLWNSIPEEQRRGIIDYTDYFYEDMNEAMRLGDIGAKGERVKRKIIDAYKGMEHFELPTDMKLYRGMGRERSLARALGISEDDLRKAISDKSLVGMTFSEKGFGSTAANWNKAWHKPIMLDIVAPAGTKGMYVDLISENPGEREILLQTGTIFEILDVDTVEHRYREVIRLKVVIIGVEKMAGL